MFITWFISMNFLCFISILYVQRDANQGRKCCFALDFLSHLLLELSADKTQGMFKSSNAYGLMQR